MRGETTALSAQSEAGDDGAVPLHVGAREVVEQAPAPADHLEQPAPRGVILGSARAGAR